MMKNVDFSLSKFFVKFEQLENESKEYKDNETKTIRSEIQNHQTKNQQIILKEIDNLKETVDELIVKIRNLENTKETETSILSSLTTKVANINKLKDQILKVNQNNAERFNRIDFECKQITAKIEDESKKNEKMNTKNKNLIKEVVVKVNEIQKELIKSVKINSKNEISFNEINQKLKESAAALFDSTESIMKQINSKNKKLNDKLDDNFNLLKQDENSEKETNQK